MLPLFPSLTGHGVRTQSVMVRAYQEAGYSDIHAFNLYTQKADLCECDTSLVYIVSFRTPCPTNKIKK